ncbi:unnamed protein product [Rotaria sp. Silwood1]|nr:unnamed protein product [Rotaria sp. Silwood1]CAF1278024.1 unnamed protein product [Rotaria sp. Silwood1]CAF1567739.1 unnamed protein product [Rotaria sp. Silwood1]CAF3559347.1 unnamed protein product [Rotaria sp. Silwood1]CAF4798278.1 unnamed protein product [Rotaria sp. Silwood1]
MSRPGRFKMVLLGESAVGKSSLALQLAKGLFQENAESTIGAAFFTHTLKIDPHTSLHVELWDTAGQERYHSLAPMYYRGAQAALIVYDITNYNSFLQAKKWVRELRQVKGTEIIIGLAGNKSDLTIENKRQVDIREGAEYADENGLIFMETSAKRGENVTEIFMNVARQVAIKQSSNTLSKSSGIIPSPKSNISCCSNNTNSKT